VATIALLAFRNLRQLPLISALVMAAVAVSVAVVTALGMLVEGLLRNAEEAASDGNVLVLADGALELGASSLRGEVAAAVRALPGVATSAHGPLVSTELVVTEEIDCPRLGQTIPTTVRGVEPIALAVHDRLAVTDGSSQLATGDVLLGASVARQLGAGVGSPVMIAHRPWRVAGIFSAGGSALESEVWARRDDLAVLTRRTTPSVVVFRTDGPHAVQAAADALNARKDLGVRAMPESSFQRSRRADADRLRVFAIVMALLLGLGSSCGAMNAIYASLGARRAEIGVMRTLGFTPLTIGTLVMAEGVFLGLAGGVLGCLLGGLVAVAPVQMTTAGGSLRVQPDAAPPTLLLAVALGAVIGGLGAALPARQASRLSVVAAVRAE
jgi:putative ABC transport system permease protein